MSFFFKQVRSSSVRLVLHRWDVVVVASLKCTSGGLRPWCPFRWYKLGDVKDTQGTWTQEEAIRPIVPVLTNPSIVTHPHKPMSPHCLISNASRYLSKSHLNQSASSAATVTDLEALCTQTVSSPRSSVIIPRHEVEGGYRFRCRPSFRPSVPKSFPEHN